MMGDIFINLAVEDELSEVVLRKVLRETKRPFVVGTCFRKRGFGYLKSKLSGFNNACKGTPFLILTDLDRKPCPQLLI